MIVNVILLLSLENFETSTRMNFVEYVVEKIKQFTERLIEINTPNGFKSISANSSFQHVIGK
jgi:hypothetical protein